MKKILLLFAFVFFSNAFSQPVVTINSLSCSSVTYRIQYTIPNGSYLATYSSPNLSMQGFLGLNTTLTFNSNVAFITYNLTTYNSYTPFGFFINSINGVNFVPAVAAPSFFKDPTPDFTNNDLNFPGTFNGNILYSDICQKNIKEFFITEVSSGIGDNPNPSLPTNNTNYRMTFNVYHYDFATFTQGALLGTFTDDINNVSGTLPYDGVDIPATLIFPPGGYRFVNTSIEELGDYTVSSFGPNCNSDITFTKVLPAFGINVIGDPILTGPNTLSVFEPLCLGSNGSVNIQLTGIPNGVYDVQYNLSGANVSSQIATGVNFTSGTGTFTVPSSALTNAGNSTIEVTSIIYPNSCAYDFVSGSLTDTFIVGLLPDLSGVNTVSVSEPLCLGTGAMVSVNFPNLADGNYDFIYNLSGANISVSTVTGVNISSGLGSFVVLSSALTNAGTTNISLSSVVDSTTGCTSTITPGTITDSFVINTLPNLTGTNTVSVSEPLCLGTGAMVSVNFPNLADGTYSLIYTLTGANASAGGVSVTGVNISSGLGSFVVLSSALTNAGTTTIEINGVSNEVNTCTSYATGTITDSFVINTLPNLTGTNSVNMAEPICLGSNGTVTFNASSLTNGTYTLIYTLTGANTSAGGVSVTGVNIASGTGTFTIPSSALTNAGTTTIEINAVSNEANTCTSYASGTITDSFVISALPNVAGGTNSVAVAEPICLGSNGTVTFNASALTNGTYNIAYTLTGANASTQTASGVVVASGTGTFTIPSSALTNAGTTTISLSSVVTSASGCTTTITPGTITDSFVISALPNVTGGTNSVSVAEPICLGSNGTVTFNASAMANGTYNIAYTLTGANASTQTASGVVVASGTGTFTIPSSALTNAGTTTISLSSVVTSASGCTTTITPGTITDSFVISALPNVAGGTNSVSVAEPICLGSNGTVTFNASAMANGTYNIAYTLTGANASTQTASGVVVASGVGTFTIPSSALTNAGTTTISLSSVVTSASGCTTTITPGTITDSFVINALPNVTGGTNSVSVAEPLCLGSNGAVTFNASAMANGTYNIAYTLTGANASTQTASGVVVASGVGTFTIPSSALTNAGTTTISLSSVVTSASGCTTTITPGTITDSFVISALPNVTGGTNSVSVAEPICLGSNGTVTFNASAMANGTYNIAYTLTGANASTQTASGVVVASGTGTFTIPSSALTNAGTTTISLVSIEASSTCTAFFSTSVSDAFEVGDRPVLSGAATQNFCEDANATINDLVVNFSGVNWYDSATSTTPLDGTTILVDGVTYYGEAINSLTGCTSEVRLEVTANITSCEFLIPDGFSPNNDGVNDVYNIVNGNLYYPNYSIEVYDRYGSLIHKGKNWDGTYNGKLLPASVYFIIVNYNNNSKKPTQHRIYLNK